MKNDIALVVFNQFATDNGLNLKDGQWSTSLSFNSFASLTLPMWAMEVACPFGKCIFGFYIGHIIWLNVSNELSDIWSVALESSTHSCLSIIAFKLVAILVKVWLSSSSVSRLVALFICVCCGKLLISYSSCCCVSVYVCDLAFCKGCMLLSLLLHLLQFSLHL